MIQPEIELVLFHQKIISLVSIAVGITGMENSCQRIVCWHLDPKGTKNEYDSTALMLARKSLCDLYDSTKEVMVMGDLPQARPTYVLKRGLYDSHGDKVEPSTPAAIMPFPKELPKNRLGLAQWMFDDENPLTSRVAVNRMWQLVFGKGLVSTSDDLATRAPCPPIQNCWIILRCTTRKTSGIQRHS